jgi:alkanesulfonate monooxygenase SsuD/methylene tetrahydromethanopterin reductase-like flavin-dependent oxidoreductase (luciferase family)
MTLKIGIGTFSGQLAPGGQVTGDVYADIVALARAAEAADFDAVWVSSHHGVDNGHIPSPLVLLAAIAAVTERITLGTAVVVAPFQHPLRFAEDCIGSGWRQEEFDAFGVPMKERGSRTAELAEVCRAAWHQRRFTFEGRHYRYHDVAVTPRPCGPPRLFLGGGAPRAIERAGRLGDGFLATGTPQAGLPALAAQVAAFDTAVRSHGRDPRRLAIGFQANAWVSKDGTIPPSVKQAMWNQIAAHLAWHAGSDGHPSGPVDEDEIQRRGFLGSPGDVVERIRPWIETFPGRELHLLLRLHYPGLDRSQAEETVRLFGDEVIPELRRLHAAATSARPAATGPR